MTSTAPIVVTRRPRLLPLSRCALALLLLAGAVPLWADTTAMDAARLQKLKQATVYLQVKLPNGQVAAGSGFFAEEPGLVVTNAHVLGMLDRDSRKPLQIDVVVRGATGSQTLPAKVVSIDRDNDLGLVRVTGKDLPAPLPFGPTRDLLETADIYIFGYPFGKRLGQEITVSKSSISSLRNAGADLKQIQVNGGMHPGNSGGPVTDAKGQVVGVAVSGLKNTQIHFAIPSDQVRRFLNGRVDTWHRETPYKDGDTLRMEVSIDTIDPLSRLKKVALEYWVGNPGPNRAPSGTDPQPAAGDLPKQVVVLDYDKLALARGEIVVPALNPGQVLWTRPVVTNAAGQTEWRTAAGVAVRQPVDRKPLVLKYQPETGATSFVALTSTSTLKARTDDGEMSLRSKLTVGLREQLAGEADKGQFRIEARFTRLNLQMFVNDKVVKGDEELKKDLQALRVVSTLLEMDADGSCANGKVDLSKVPETSRENLSDIAEQVVQSLEVLTVPLPGDTVKPLQSWKAQRLLAVGPLGQAVPAQADLRYTYLGVRDRNGRQEPYISMKGTLRGRRGDGGNLSGSLTGTLSLLPTTGQVVDAGTSIKLDLDLVAEGKALKVNGTLQVNLQRSDKPIPVPEKK